MSLILTLFIISSFHKELSLIYNCIIKYNTIKYLIEYFIFIIKYFRLDSLKHSLYYICIFNLIKSILILTSISYGLDFTFMSDSQNEAINLNNKVDQPNIHIHKPDVNVTLPGLVTGITYGAAIRAGTEKAKHVPSIGDKIVATAATAAATVSTVNIAHNVSNTLADKINQSITSDSNKQFLPSNFNWSDFNWDMITKHVEGLDQYPLNLIPDLSILTTSSILFVFILVNIHIAGKIKDINIFNYLPKWSFISSDKPIGKFIKYYFNLYTTIYEKMGNIMIIFSLGMLFFNLILIKFCLLIILHSG